MGAISPFTLLREPDEEGVMEPDAALQSILQMLRSADDPGARLFPPTELYSEGWMLRLLLWHGARGADCLPVRAAEGSGWYSEARLDSPFLKCPGGESNHLAEGQTHADGVLGHFAFRGNTEAGLVVPSDARQLVVFEAKMMSRLSRGTTRAPDYDQAARNVACMAWTLRQAGLHADDLDSLGFFVVAPAELIERESSFRAWVSQESIARKVEARVEDYKLDPERHDALKDWLLESFHPLLGKLELECVAWEDLLERISTSPDHTQLSEFYQRCLRYNRGVHSR